MSGWTQWAPADRWLEFLLVVAVAVTLASSIAWFLARWFTRSAPLRHLFLVSALFCCLASPALAWISATAGLTLVSVPLLCEHPTGTASGETTSGASSLGRQTADDTAEMRRVAAVPPPALAPSPRPNGPGSGDVVDCLTCPTGQSAAPFTSPEASSESVRNRGPGQAARQASFRELAATAVYVWAAGVLLLSARLARRCGRVIRLRRSASPVRGDRPKALLHEVVSRLDVRRLPLLLVSDRSVVPLAVGFGRPAVVLPEPLLGAVSDDELRDVLVHEVAHLRRGDHWIVLLQELAGTFYWPVLSVHALNRELRRACEDICDNVVLAGRDPLRYGETLLHVAELLVKARPVGASVGMLGGHGELERRITRLIDPRRSTMTKTGRKTMFAVMFLFLVCGAIASTTRFAEAGAEVPAADAVAEDALPGPQETTSPSPAPPSGREDLKHAARFSGRVTGPDGRPVRDARIYLVPNSGFRSTGLSEGGTVLLNPLGSIGPVWAQTDAEGAFAFDAPEMTYTTAEGLAARREGLLMAAADGLAADWIEKTPWDPAKGTELNLRLSEVGVPIRGRVLGPDGRPLAAALVRIDEILVPEDRDLDGHLREVTSVNAAFLSGPDYERSLEQPDLVPGLVTEARADADGRFTVSGLGRDWIARLRVSAPGAVTTVLTVMTRVAPAVEARRDLGWMLDRTVHGAGFTARLEPGRTVKGRVVDRDSGDPVPGMWVGPAQNFRAGVSPRLYPWRTDEEGRFTITGLPPELAQEVVMAVAPPGVPYQMAGDSIAGNQDVVIECPRGIPFRLMVLDEQGKPVEAEVTYADVRPNPHVEMLVPRPEERYHWPNAPAARRADGSYEGFVLPGPGAVLVDLPESAGYRPAHVDPKAFFAPGRTDWAEDEEWVYGTRDTLSTNGEYGPMNQADYEAIVLVNPRPNSGPLELSAAVARDRPRQVHFVDPEGNPVHDVTWTRYGSQYFEHMLPLRGLHPDRARLLTYLQTHRRLVGFLEARGDGDSPYTVRMQRWGAVTGRVVDENGAALSGARIAVDADHPAEAERRLGAKTDAQGRFVIGELIPGHGYNAKVLYGERTERSRAVTLFAGYAFEDLMLGPGEARDLGEIRTIPPVYERFPLSYEGGGTKSGN